MTAPRPGDAFHLDLDGTVIAGRYMASYPQLELDRQLCFALYTASRAVVRIYGPLLDEAGLTYPQYVTLLALWDLGSAANRLSGPRSGLNLQVSGIWGAGNRENS